MAQIDIAIGLNAFEIIRRRLGEILADELPEQSTLNRLPELNATVFVERSVPFNAVEFPAVNVKLADGEYVMDTLYNQNADYTYHVDVHASAPSSTDGRGDLIAMEKAHRLAGVIRSIIMHPKYYSLGFEQGFIAHRSVRRIQSIPDEAKDSDSVAICRLEVAVKTDEYTELQVPPLIAGYDTEIVIADSDVGYVFMSPETVLNQVLSIEPIQTNGNVILNLSGNPSSQVTVHGADLISKFRLEQLLDINATGRTDGQIIQWNAGSGVHTYVDPPSGENQIMSGGNVSTEGDITIGLSGSPASTIRIIGEDLLGSLELGYVGDVDISARTTGRILQWDGLKYVHVDPPSGGGSPGGADTQVQYNNSGSFAGSDTFSFDSTDSRLRLGLAKSPEETLDAEGNLNMDQILPTGGSIPVSLLNVPGNMTNGSHQIFFQFVDRFGNTTDANKSSSTFNIADNTTAGQVRITVSAHPNPKVASINVFYARATDSFGANYFAVNIPNTDGTYDFNFSDAEIDGTRSGFRQPNTTGGQIKVNGTPVIANDQFTTIMGVGVGTKGNSAVYIGTNAHATGTGNNNTAVGFNTMSVATTARNCTAVGNTAMLVVSSGIDNTSVGTQSSRQLTTGSRNTVAGVDAMRRNATGHDNSFFGYRIQFGANPATANRSTAVGNEAFRNAAALTDSVALGYKAGDGLNTGTNVILVGANVQARAATDSNYMNLGDTIEADLSTGEVTLPKLNIANIPTSAAGLNLGDVWNDSGTLKIVT